MGITIHDVARKAGVSPATVSLIYNQTEHSKRLSEATRQRVQAVIAELGYQPNAGARSIRLKRYESMGVNFAGHGYSNVPGQFYTQMLDGVQNAAADGDYLCVLSRTLYESDDVPKFLRMRCVDGFMAMHRLNATTYASAVRANIPFLVLNAPAPEGIPSLLFDDAGATTQVLDQLLARGHRRIAYLPANTKHDSGRIRKEQYTQWVTQHSLPCCIAPPWNLEGEAEQSDTFDWVNARTTGPEAFTAVLFYSQMTFYQFVRFQLQRSSDIPQFSAAVCEFCSHSNFELDNIKPAGMEYRPFEMGWLATKMMIRHLTEGIPLESQIISPTWFDGNTIQSI